MAIQPKYQLTVVTTRTKPTIKQYLESKFFIDEETFDKFTTSKKLINLSISQKVKGDQPAVNNANNIWVKWDDDQRYLVSFASSGRISSGEFNETILAQFGGSVDFDAIQLNFGTQIALPQELLDAIQPTFFDEAVVWPFKKFKSFIGDEIKKIIEDEKYAAVTQTTLNPKASVVKKYEKISVLVYSKALGGEMLDLTPFLINCNTNVAKTGGNFQITLPPITAEFFRPKKEKKKPRKNVPMFPSGGSGAGSGFVPEPGEGYWKIKEGVLVSHGDGEYAFKDNMYLDGSASVGTDDEVPNSQKQNKYYFSNVIQQNDVVLIKYEELALERDRKSKKVVDGYANTTLGEAINGDVFDMIGLVDTVGENQNPGGADVAISIAGRDMVKMIIDDGTIFFPGGVGDTSGGITNYQSTFFLNSEIAKKSDSFARFFTNRRLNGELKDTSLYIFQTIPFWLKYILTKLSTAKIVFESKIPFLQTSDSDEEPVEGDDIERLGLWRVVRVVVDPQIRNRKLADSSIASDSGSLLNFINKFCQEPFIEFWTDTYGDRFYWIARKPPWAGEAFLDNYSIDIDDSNVLSTSLSFTDGETYSWYRLTPQVFYEGNSENSNFYHPMVYFPEFAELYGARAFDIKSTYINYSITGKTSQAGYLQGIEDLRWLIKAHAHLVFCRKGTITINRDRRIKRGMSVYLRSSDELFYVDGVSHSYNISRNSTDGVTTLQVSRGIVKKHASRYFDLIDTSTTFSDENQFTDNVEIDLEREEKPESIELGTVNVEVRRQYNWHVRKENFEFLMRREQFE